MAVVSTARTEWSGGLVDGTGSTSLASGVASFAVNWKARSEGAESTTTPEELLAAAHASCYSMALSNVLAKAGNPPASLVTHASVSFVPGTGVTGVELSVEGDVPGLDAEAFAAAAADARENCPISQALSVPITLASAILV